jgi:MFS family permease
MDRLDVPLIAQAIATGAISTVVCVLLAIAWSAIDGSQAGIAYIVAPAAAWCGFFAVLIGRLLDRFARLYVAALVVEIAAVAVETVLIVSHS